MLTQSLPSCPTLCDPVDCSQAPLSMGFSRQEHWSGLPFPPPGDLPDPRIEPALQADSLPLSHQGSSSNIFEKKPNRSSFDPAAAFGGHLFVYRMFAFDLGKSWC